MVHCCGRPSETKQRPSVDLLVPVVLHGGQHVGVSWYGTSGSYDGYLIIATLLVDKLHNIKRFTNTREPYTNKGKKRASISTW